ncbi:MAG: M50 family metallopeptidase [Planctomycetales bacterium]|nr:M50 family metallopeptidase [Planctomycetales bacterium]
MVKAWSERIDPVVAWLKWPSAALAALASPLLAWALARLLWRCLIGPWLLLPFVSGGLLFFIVWRRWLGKSRWGKALITLEHEMTHALFAWLTLHPVLSMWASGDEVGHVRFRGQPNWLIAVAPYFFPTAALLMFLIAFLMPFQGLPWRSFLLGVALSYHIISTYRETHRDQSDLRYLGTLFCWLFLPAANLAVLGFLLAYAHGGADGIHQWCVDAWEPVAIANERFQLFNSYGKLD